MKFKSLPRGAQVFILILFALSVFFLFLLKLYTPITTISGRDLFILLLVLLFISFSDTFVVSFALTNSNNISITLSLPLTFASIFLFNPLLATLVSSIGSVIGDTFSKREWFKTMFNFSQYVITVGLSSVIYNFIISLERTRGLPFLTGFSAVAVAGLVYFLLNSFLVSTITALASKNKILDALLFMFRRNEIILQFISMFILGGLFAYILKTEPLAMILLVPLLAAVYYSFKRVSELEESTEKFMELIAEIVDGFDKYTREHSENVARICEKVADELRLDLVEKRKLIMAAKIHDFGKIAVPI